MKRISFLFGTRPEAIKLSPLIKVFKESNNFHVSVCSTGQHREMLSQILPLFDIELDVDLNLMVKDQSLAGFMALGLKSIDAYLEEFKPEYVVVQGDTSTVLAATMAAFYKKIKVIHIEAGLRTWDKYSPFPEEMNRIITSKIAELHFAPTKLAKQNLLREQIDQEKIFVTGNTGIDALLQISDKIKSNKEELNTIKTLNKFEAFANNKIVLVTGHRRENFGDGFINICEAIKTSALNHPDYIFIYPVHLNPNVSKIVHQQLDNVNNIKLIPPADYLTFIALMEKSYIILTDSGGVQEEAPSLNKPIIVMRESTERPEGIDAGCSILVGTDVSKITQSISKLINNKEEYNRMSSISNPYGNGQASIQILNIINQINV